MSSANMPLEKCPLCCGTASLYHWTDSDYSGEDMYYVMCDDCGIRMDADDVNGSEASRASAIAKWNALPRREKRRA